MISLLGISYKTAPVEVREQFAFTKEEISSFSELILDDNSIEGLVVLSTCNRMEIYISHDKCCHKKALNFLMLELKKFKSVEQPVFQSYFYTRTDQKAVEHLFEVTSGIDSMIIGEDQIIGQVKDAYLYSTDNAFTDAVLMRLFQKSFEAGKRVRTETGIKMGATSVSYAAVEVCNNLFSTLSDKKILLIGAGETGGLALHNIAKKGVSGVTVTNRTYSKAEKLAKKFDGQVLDFSEYSSHITTTDIVIVATGSQSHLVTKQMVLDARKSRSEKQIFIDLSVPRNIEKSVGEIEGVQLFGVDDLQDVIQSNTEKRKQYVDAARSIIDEITQEFNEWVSSRALRPTIKAITSNLQKINKTELESYRKIDSDEMQKAINEYASHLTQKYTRMLIKNLREITNNGKNTEYLKAVSELFEM